MQTLTSKHQTIVEMDSLAGIHRVTIFKPSESKYLLARVVMMDDLFYYLYPFRLLDLFQGNLTKHERLVRVEFVKTFSSKYIEKYFYIRQFLTLIKSLIKRSKTLNKSLLILFIFSNNINLLRSTFYFYPIEVG